MPRGWLNLCLLMALGLALPSRAEAQTLWNGYRNETRTPIILQFLKPEGQGVPIGPPVILYPNEVRWEAVGDASPRMMLVRQQGAVGQLPARIVVNRPVGTDMLYVVRHVAAPDGRTPVLQVTRQPTQKPGR
ncbi:MAG TPA: hypothetical protein PKD86_12820 [Gemmatales bacterium]|nr:hypothetical protein [Gemmatales bacterium]HMP60226.1 hypothetical protein [Gemmatales bacterium]